MKLSTFLKVGLVSLLLIAVSACGQQPSEVEETTAPTAAANAVTIANYAYSPSVLKIKKGTTVTWTNQDQAQHTVTWDDADPGFKSSDYLKKGESVSYTFAKTGTFAYHCEPHPYMKGSVEVSE